jgi:CubicO group peptidase (beta-lactamase class C family)
MIPSPPRRPWLLLLPLLLAAAWLLSRAFGQTLHPDPLAIPSVGQPAPPPPWADATNRSRALLRAALAQNNLPGLSVAVAAGGTLVWAEGFGWADLAARAPVTPTTRFRLGTASTLLTAAAAARLQLETPNPTTGPTGEPEPLSRLRCEHPSEALPHLSANPSPNQRWILVSAAIESASGQPFLRYLQDQILQPLQMANTGAESATAENPEGIGEEGEDPPPFTILRQAILEPLGIAPAPVHPPTRPATLYEPGFPHHPLARHGLRVLPARNLSCYSGARALFSTPSDLVRFALATPAVASTHGELHGHRLVALEVDPTRGLVVALAINGTTADPAALARAVAAAFKP